MTELLKHVPPEWIFFGAFMLGQWWSDRRHFSSRRDLGMRVGGLAGRVNKIEGLLRVTPDPPVQGHGE